jgi:GntR family transcriptional regulator
MYLRIDPGSGVPLGTQILRQLRLAVASGRLTAGERLPSARDCAAEVGVNFHTVRKAYAELEREGLLETRRGLGTFVAARVSKLGADELRGLVAEHVGRLREDLAGSEIPGEQVEELLVEEWRRSGLDEGGPDGSDLDERTES